MGGDGQGVEGVRITRKWRDGGGGKHALLGAHERWRSMTSPIPIRHLERVRRLPKKQRRRRVRRATPSSLFSREGGSPVWIPAFAGRQADLDSRDTPSSSEVPRHRKQTTKDVLREWMPKQAGMTDCALTPSDLTILPRQAEVAPKVAEGEDAEQRLPLPPPPTGKRQPPPPCGGGSCIRLSAARRPPAYATASEAHRSQQGTHYAPSRDRRHGSR